MQPRWPLDQIKWHRPGWFHRICFCSFWLWVSFPSLLLLDLLHYLKEKPQRFPPCRGINKLRGSRKNRKLCETGTWPLSESNSAQGLSNRWVRTEERAICHHWRRQVVNRKRRREGSTTVKTTHCTNTSIKLSTHNTQHVLCRCI